jgi:hypothetical protein
VLTAITNINNYLNIVVQSMNSNYINNKAIIDAKRNLDALVDTSVTNIKEIF